MSPEVAQAVRDQSPCPCGAQPGDHCLSDKGRPMPWIHQARVELNLFAKDLRCYLPNLPETGPRRRPSPYLERGRA